MTHQDSSLSPRRICSRVLGQLSGGKYFIISDRSHLKVSSLPHWLAFWAVGFKWSIIDYAQKIENLFAKMEGVRTLVLPPNREVVDKYLTLVWILVHTLTAAASSLSSGLDGAEKFKLHLEAEEARLGKNLRAVDYVVDGIDTLKLITGGGRIEKVRI